MAGREFTVQAIFEVFNVLKSYFWDLPSTTPGRPPCSANRCG